MYSLSKGSIRIWWQKSWKLVQCQTLEARECLLNAAFIHGDERLAMELSGNYPIAIEVKYHRTHCKIHTLKKALRPSKSQKKKWRSRHGSWRNLPGSHTGIWSIKDVRFKSTFQGTLRTTGQPSRKICARTGSRLCWNIQF